MRCWKKHVDIRDVTQKTRALADALKSPNPSTDPELNQLTTFKSARRALGCVWSKDKISQIERTLSAFRDQLNLHMCKKLRCTTDIGLA